MFNNFQLFRAIEESCQTLLYCLEGYQDRICGLAHEENSMGLFLKECGKVDKTRAGKMMIATGKALSFSAQQRIQLRNPLVRLYQEVETFQYRAVADTLMTIDKMEKARTAYRGALLWMKDASQQLDPDTYKQLDKFRKVQGHVRRTKTRFDKLKLDTLQKVDLLSASRCNMYSHALVGYQNALLTFWEKTSRTMNAIAESFKGYQYYEFNMLRELTETSKKLAEETASCDDIKKIFDEDDDDDKDRLIFFESEYHDDLAKKKDNKKDKKDGKTNKKNQTKKSENKTKKPKQQQSSDMVENKKEDMLLDINSTLLSLAQSSTVFDEKSEYNKKQLKDILTASDLEADDLTILNEILNTPTTPVIESSLIDSNHKSNSYMPSQILDLDKELQNLKLDSSVPPHQPIKKEEKSPARNKVIKIFKLRLHLSYFFSFSLSLGNKAKRHVTMV